MIKTVLHIFQLPLKMRVSNLATGPAWWIYWCTWENVSLIHIYLMVRLVESQVISKYDLWKNNTQWQSLLFTRSSGQTTLVEPSLTKSHSWDLWAPGVAPAQLTGDLRFNLSHTWDWAVRTIPHVFSRDSARLPSTCTVCPDEASMIHVIGKHRLCQ
jgi:hypothetical protein